MKRSTRTTDRRTAQKLADAWEDAARRRSTRNQAHRVLADILGETQTGSVTLSSWCEGWLAEIRASVAPATLSVYTGGIDHFLTYLGKRASTPLLHLTRNDVVKYRAALEAAHPTTANARLKLVKMVLARAREAGHHLDDVFSGIKLFRTREAVGERRPFTMDELKAVLAVADAEWRSMILFGATLGLRLGDVCAMRWKQVSMERREVSLRAQKTGQEQILPLAPRVIESLNSLPGQRDKGEFIHLRAAALVVGARGKVSTVSRQFRELLVEAGVVEKRTGGHEGQGKGRTATRNLSDLTFHSLRHTARSFLEAAGVPLKTAMSMLGHSDASMSLRYAHVDGEALRRASDSLPSIG